MQPPALPCRRLFILSLPKNLFSMKKLFGSYLFWTRTLSVLCILLFPVVELLVCGDVSVAVCTLLMSESGGAAMLLATRFSEGRDALCCAVLMFASMACCHFVGAGPGFAVFAAIEGMPFEAMFVGIGKITERNLHDMRICGNTRHGSETVGNGQRRRIYVKIDVAVFHHQPHAQRADKVGFGPDAAPRPDNIEFFDYFTRPGGISQRKIHYFCFHKVFRFAAKLQKNGGGSLLPRRIIS